MKTVILFHTAGYDRVKAALEALDAEHNQVYLLAPKSRCAVFSKEYEGILCIPTEKEYIDYQTITAEKRIPDIPFDEAWVPSSQQDNYYAFGEAYAVIDDINCKKAIWLAADGTRRPVFTGTSGFAEKMKNLLIRYTFWIARKMAFIKTKLRGYRW